MLKPDFLPGRLPPRRGRQMIVILLLLGTLASKADTFRVATYNVENYLDQPTETRKYAKSAKAKAKVCESIRALNPDVLALEEMGSTNALLELRRSLKAKGLDFPYWEHVQGWDTNIHVAILSKLPIVANHPHTNENFLLDGRRFAVSRGIAEVTLQAATNFTFTLIATHLKSRRPVPEADEAQLRLQEAKILRGIVDRQLQANPDAKIVVLGDFNDVKDSESTKAVIGRGKFKLTDTRPAERNGDSEPNEVARFEPRNVTWTHYYGKEDTYSRIDYILLSPAMARYWVKKETYILTLPNWGVGSDHRPIVATFTTAAE
jgi:endonuclease/exonuclease/phosphatase family metal-dependent hydrolase